MASPIGMEVRIVRGVNVNGPIRVGRGFADLREGIEAIEDGEVAGALEGRMGALWVGIGGLVTSAVPEEECKADEKDAKANDNGCDDLNGGPLVAVVLVLVFVPA